MQTRLKRPCRARRGGAARHAGARDRPGQRAIGRTGISSTVREQLLCLPPTAPMPGARGDLRAGRGRARDGTFAVAASLLRHIPAEAVYLSIHPADTPEPDARRMRCAQLLDARSAALADHGLDMRTEVRLGDLGTELLRELLAHEPTMLVLGLGDLARGDADVAAAVARGPGASARS